MCSRRNQPLPDPNYCFICPDLLNSARSLPFSSMPGSNRRNMPEVSRFICLPMSLLPAFIETPKGSPPHPIGLGGRPALQPVSSLFHLSSHPRAAGRARGIIPRPTRLPHGSALWPRPPPCCALPFFRRWPQRPRPSQPRHPPTIKKRHGTCPGRSFGIPCLWYHARECRQAVPGMFQAILFLMLPSPRSHSTCPSLRGLP